MNSHKLKEKQIDWLCLVLSPIPFDEEYYNVSSLNRADTWVEQMYGESSPTFWKLYEILTKREYGDGDKELLNKVREDWIKWDTKNIWKEYND